MAKKKATQKNAGNKSLPAAGAWAWVRELGEERTAAPSAEIMDSKERPKFTGKQIVTLNKSEGVNQFLKHAKTGSMRLAALSDFKSERTIDAVDKALKEADGVVFEKLKVAVVNENARPQMRLMMESAKFPAARTIRNAEPERFVYATATRRATRTFADSVNATWGLQAVNAIRSNGNHYTGKGVRIAILDTGISQNHPDFKNRISGSRSFVPNSMVEDGNGHGSHCAGIAAADIKSGTTLQYGVAPGAELYIAKVLNNKGEGKDSYIFAGLEWALENKCRIISMSLGSEIEPGESYYESYEMVAKEALDNNCLLIAAAGNDSTRPQKIKPVNHPANCPSIMAIASVDTSLNVSWFSCGGTRLGEVDIAGPGEQILSAWKKGGYRVEDGTSMATPFVSGVAALLCEKYPRFTMKGIRSRLLGTAMKLRTSKSDTGAGLVYFP